MTLGRQSVHRYFDKLIAMIILKKYPNFFFGMFIDKSRRDILKIPGFNHLDMYWATLYPQN